MLALVVDDSKMARYMLSKMLKQQSIDVDTVESGEEALGYLCNSDPDMIFMDHTMPGMDGFQTVRAIKNDPKTAPIPIMMYTSKEGEVYMNQALELGAVDVLPKELKPEQLVAVLEKQRLLPHLAEADKNSDGKEAEAPARVVTASDLGEDIAQVAKAAEKSIENKNFTNQVRRMLDDHKDDLAEQAKERTEGLLDQFDERLQQLTSRIEQISPSSQIQPSAWQRFSSGTRGLIITIFGLLIIWGIVDNLQKSEQLTVLTSEVAQLRESLTTEDAKAEATQSELERELQEITYEQQLQANEWLANFEWAINQNNQFPWDQKPFNDELAERVGVIANRLQAAGFQGTIVLTSHLGSFCLTSDANGAAELPEDEQVVSSCNINSMREEDAETLGMEQSMAFNHFVAAFEIQFDDTIRLELATNGNQSPVQAYPEQEPELLASEWNQVAASNNRIAIELKPDS